MEIVVRKRDDVTILDIAGRIAGSDSLDLKRAIDAQIEIAAGNIAKIVLNLERVRIVDSFGLGVIVAAYTSIQRNGGRIALLNVGGNIKNLIVMAKLMTIFDRYDNEDEAVASFQ